MRNRDLKFICRPVDIRIETAQSLFTNGFEDGQRVRWPIAHADGNYFADAETLRRVEGQGMVAFRYCRADGAVEDDGNPNGAQHNIAGLFNETKTVLGLMPHPERASDALLGSTDGKPFFEGLCRALS